MAGYVDFKTAESVPSGGPSPVIWADCPVITFERDPGKGLHLFDDFLSGQIANDATRVGQYFSLVGTNPDVNSVTDEVSGVLLVAGSGAGDDEAYLVSNILYELKKENHKKMWFEAKIKFTDADQDATFLCGLGEASLLAAEALVDEGASRSHINDYDYIGFHSDNDGTNMDNIDAVYHEDGDSGVVTKVDEEVVTITAGATTYDDKYIQFGMKYDGVDTVVFYIDGVATGTTLSVDDFATNTADELDPLGIIIGYKDLAGAVSGYSIDWARFACER